MSIVSRIFGSGRRPRVVATRPRAIIAEGERVEAVARFMKLPPDEQISRFEELAALMHGHGRLSG